MHRFAPIGAADDRAAADRLACWWPSPPCGQRRRRSLASDDARRVRRVAWRLFGAPLSTLVLER
jgi:hypothetical protein